MQSNEPWSSLSEAIAFAGDCIVDDVDSLNDAERADGQRYVMRILRAVAETSLLTFDFDRPSFITMHDSVRHLGAAGPDIDYDVAVLAPGRRWQVVGHRGGATYVGIVVYGAGGEAGASAILDAVDIDNLADASGAFRYDVVHPEASRVIVRQYFHDRATQNRGSWEIEALDAPPASVPAPSGPHPAIVAGQIANSAATIRWNAQLNRLWTPERRAYPNEFTELSAHDIVAAVPNPDVSYSFACWKLADGESLMVEVQPPDTRYWSIQLCDRWFQSYPQRQTNLHDRQVRRESDGSVRCVLAEHDPGTGNWLDTGGHQTGVVFFRWLHASPATTPTARVVGADDIA